MEVFDEFRVKFMERLSQKHDADVTLKKAARPDDGIMKKTAPHPPKNPIHPKGAEDNVENKTVKKTADTGDNKENQKEEMDNDNVVEEKTDDTDQIRRELSETKAFNAQLMLLLHQSNSMNTFLQRTTPTMHRNPNTIPWVDYTASTYSNTTPSTFALNQNRNTSTSTNHKPDHILPPPPPLYKGAIKMNPPRFETIDENDEDDDLWMSSIDKQVEVNGIDIVGIVISEERWNKMSGP
eukprot:840791_1